MQKTQFDKKPITHQSNSIFTPELIKLIKIFGFSSLAFVLILSFFNERKAQNTGEENPFKISDSNRIFFLNLRSIAYDREHESKANMTLFRSSNRLTSDSSPLLDLVLILNSPKDEAYLHLEPVNLEWPLRIRVTHNSEYQVFKLTNGNKFDQKSYLDQLRPWIKRNASFELEAKGKWVPIWASPKEKEVLKTVIEDYFRLLNQLN